jgi:hypothetical protein
VNDDEMFAELAQLRPDLDAGRLAEIRSLPPELRAAVLQQLADQDWTHPSPDAGERFLAIVSALGAVGSAVGAVAGAAAGVKAL